jgi:hypothetical protein
MDTMLKSMLRAALAGAMLCVPAIAHAQTSPPTTAPTNPQSKGGATIVVNPTEDECKRGWQAGMRWTKPQFDEFCTKLKASK